MVVVRSRVYIKAAGSEVTSATAQNSLYVFTSHSHYQWRFAKFSLSSSEVLETKKTIIKEQTMYTTIIQVQLNNNGAKNNMKKTKVLASKNA